MTMSSLALAIRAIQANARKHHKDPWRPDFHMLAEEMLELSQALRGTHEHPIWFELVQIGGIVANWLADLTKVDDAEISTFIRKLESEERK